MVGHISVVGEFFLEKAHQSLKRAIRQSNNKMVHIQSMDEEVFNDWQGRLALVAEDALRGDEGSLRGCARLLSGRNYTIYHQGALTDEHCNEIRNVLGPQACIPSLLSMSGRSVISPRTGASNADNVT